MDEDEFEILRQKRRQNLQKQVRQEQDWRQLGHGRFVATIFVFQSIIFILVMLRLRIQKNFSLCVKDLQEYWYIFIEVSLLDAKLLMPISKSFARFTLRLYS